MEIAVSRSKLNGKVLIPPSKSHTMRAILLASLANGTSLVLNPLESNDTTQMIKACQSMGAKFSEIEKGLQIEGVQGDPLSSPKFIDAGNSGQVMRFALAASLLSKGKVTLTGDHSIQNNRPIHPLIEAFKQLGIKVHKSDFPINLEGPFRGHKCTLDGSDSQPVSALLMALSFLEGERVVNVLNPGEKPWIDLTLYWLKKMGALVTHENYEKYRVIGKKSYPSFNFDVPRDYSSLSFPLAAAILTNSQVSFPGFLKDDPQGDKAILDLFQKMGASIAFEESTFTVEKSNTPLVGIEVDLSTCIDALPILAVIGTQVEGQMILKNGAIARKKESDRISSICYELKKMGAKVKELEDGLIVSKSDLKGTVLESYNDHRIGMALSVAGMIADQETTIKNSACIAKSFPGYIKTMQNIGASIK